MSKIESVRNIFAEISKQLLDSNVDNGEERINFSLGLLGSYAEVDRAYIFEYDFNNKTTSNTYEWCSPGVKPEIANLQNTNLEDIPNWVNKHLKNENLYIPNVFDLPKNDNVRLILEPQGVMSLLTIPIFLKSELVGFIGFDSVKSFKEYSEFEVETLREFGRIFLQTKMRLDSERKEKEIKEKLDFIIEASEIGIWEWDLRTNKTIFNRYWANMLGYELKEIEPTVESWKKLTNSKDLEASLQLLDKVFNKKLNRYETNIRMFHKDGHEIWVKDTGKIIEWDGEKPIRMMGTHIDITSSMEAKELNIVVREALENAPYYFLTLDENFNILFINKKTKDDFLNNNIIIKGDNFWDVLNKSTAIINFPFSNYAEIKNKGFIGDVEITTKDNLKQWFRVNLTPITDDQNKIIRYAVTGFDKTESKEAENYLETAKKRLEDELEFNIEAIKNTTIAAVLALANLTENRDQETHKHLERVQHLTKALAFLMSREEKYKYLINKKFVDTIFYASALHDIGKIVIPDRILFSTTKLTAEEREIMESHTTEGAKTLSNMIKLFPSSYEILMASQIAQSHHESFDGTGYPYQIKGENIPLSARIMTIIDVYDALRSKRRYKKALSHEEAMEVIIKESGTKFDPEIVAIFVKNDAQFEMLYESI